MAADGVHLYMTLHGERRCFLRSPAVWAEIRRCATHLMQPPSRGTESGQARPACYTCPTSASHMGMQLPGRHTHPVTASVCTRDRWVLGSERPVEHPNRNFGQVQFCTFDGEQRELSHPRTGHQSSLCVCFRCVSRIRFIFHLAC